MRIFLLKKGDLSNALGSSSNSFDELDDIFTTKLNKNAPKERVNRGNSKRHINRDLRRAIMKSSRLKNISNKTKHPNNIKNYKCIVNLNKNAKFEYFNRYNSKELQL